MLITFESKVGRITLFGDAATQLIRMMGRSGTVPSALLAAEIPEALANLRQALDAADASAAEESAEDEDETRKTPPVSLRQRAFPLIKLLEDAAREGSDVMWQSPGSAPLQF
ncbi:MAG: DUF1840 domain-containing protein [Methylotetracoccus sp.]|nr:DUF1840 domain-containing protein [Methylotetracoccus sp.]